MRLIKMGVANINTTVGAFASNTKKIIKAMEEMSKAKCTTGSFHEQVVPGYPCEDLVQWNSFVSNQWPYIQKIRDKSGELPFPTLFTLGFTLGHEGHLYNAIALICAGEILGIVPKEKLPTYGIFYDGRTFSRGIPGMTDYIKKEGIPFGDFIFSLPFGKVAVEVCEDIWSPDGPMRRRAYSGAEVIINASASPFRVGIVDTRKELISTRASDNQVTLLYINQLGGNDSLVFDGGGFLNQNGQMMKTFPRWEEGVYSVTVDLDRTTRMRHENTTWRSDCETFLKEFEPVECLTFTLGPPANQEGYTFPFPENRSFFIPQDEKPLSTRERHYEDIINALVMGLDYYNKTGAFKKLGIALSGGKDSLLTLILAWIYADRKLENHPHKKEVIESFIHCFSMPTKFNSDTTKSISALICKELGVSLKEIPLQDAFEKELEVTGSMLAKGDEVTPLTRQNIQARIRGERMQNWANSSGGMWIQTGNMSEKAVGYTTIGGDMMGAYSLIANVPKTLVIDLLQYLQEKYGFESVKIALNTKASAELQEDQEDERDLMPFPVLDACMYLFAEEKKSPSEVFEIVKHMWSDDELCKMYPGYKKGLLKDWVSRFMRLFRNSIFKWVQTPQAVHIGKLELDRERALQLPVVQSKEWMES